MFLSLMVSEGEFCIYSKVKVEWRENVVQEKYIQSLKNTQPQTDREGVFKSPLISFSVAVLLDSFRTTKGLELGLAVVRAPNCSAD